MDGQARVSVYLELKNRLKTGLDQAKQYINKNVQDIKGKLNELKTSHIEGFKSMQESVPGLGNALNLATNKYLLMGAAVAGVLAIMSKASSVANDFDQRMAKANTTAQESPAQLKKTKDELGAMAASSSLANAHEKAPAAYDVMLSSGLDRNTSLKSVPTILNTAKTTQTDPETIARALSGVMNSTGNKDSSAIMDKMMMVKNKGNAEFADIANYLPKIIPAANNAGVALDDVGGAFAYLTSMGLKSEQAATGLENAFKTLADPKKAKAFNDIGVNFYDSAGKMKPLLTMAGELKTALTGLTDKQKATVLESLGLDMESASAFSILTKDTEKLKDSIGGVSNATGELGRQSDAAKTPMDGWVQIGNQITEIYRQIGDKVNAFLGPIGQFLLDHKTSLEYVAGAVLGIAIAWGGYLLATNLATIGTGLLAAGMFALNAVMSIGLVGAIGAIIGGLVVAYHKSEKFRAILAGLMEVAKLVGDVFIGLGKSIWGALTLDMSMVKEGLTQSASAVASIMNDGINKAFDKGYNNSMKESAANAAKEAADEAAKAKAPTTPANLLTAKPNSKVQSVLDKAEKKDKKEASVSGGSQTKVITINKLSMIDGNFVSNNQEFSGMGKAEMERFLQELFQRMMINLGRSYS